MAYTNYLKIRFFFYFIYCCSSFYLLPLFCLSSFSKTYYSYSTDKGNTWSSWISCCCTGSNGFETIIAYNILFNQDSADQNKIKFKIKDIQIIQCLLCLPNFTGNFCILICLQFLQMLYTIFPLPHFLFLLFQALPNSFPPIQHILQQYPFFQLFP